MTALPRAALTLCVALATALLASAAAADDRAAHETSERGQSSLYADDAFVLRPGETAGVARVTFANGNSTLRPFASDLARSGGVFETGAEAGLAPGVSFVASGTTSGIAAFDAVSSGASAGLRVALFGATGRGPRLVTSFGAMTGLAGASGVWGRVAFAHDMGRARVATSLYGEHLFAPGHDGVDLLLTAAASYRVVGPLRAGIEYVAQDLEGIFGDDEEGLRHFAGPSMSLELMKHRLTVSAGPSFGLSALAPPVVGRAAVAYAW